MTDKQEQSLRQEKIYRAYPRLYRLALASEGERGCMAWGLAVGMGWFGLIERLSRQIEEVAARHGLREEDWPYVVQVKEKFGQLRFSVHVPGLALDENDPPTQAMLCRAAREEIIEVKQATEAESLSVCERCGAPGALIREGWWHVHCDHCEGLLKRGLLR